MAQQTATEYVIYRHGSNAANQPMTPAMPIGVYTGEGRTARERETDACRKAEAEHTVYANQYLSAKPVARASGDDQTAAWEHQEAEATLREAYAR